MSENPSYRVTGEDWDPVTPQPSEPVSWPEDPPDTTSAAPAGPPPGPAGPPLVAQAATAPLPVTAVGQPRSGGADRTIDTGTSPPGTGLAAAGPSRPGLADIGRRLPSPLGPALGRVPPRLALAGAGLVVAAVAIVIFASGRPSGVAATATAEPSVAAPIATPGCAELAAPLPIPDLVVTERDGDELRLDGFAPAEGATLDGPWPAQLGPVEASVPLGSTLRLTAIGACIGEWRAVAAHPPEKPGTPWRPETPEAQQLGWQRADKVSWAPSVPLPPRGEWIVRVTVWFRGPSASSAAATVAPGASAGGLPPVEWVVERYYRLVVEAPGS